MTMLPARAGAAVGTVGARIIRGSSNSSWAGSCPAAMVVLPAASVALPFAQWSGEVHGLCPGREAPSLSLQKTPSTLFSFSLSNTFLINSIQKNTFPFELSRMVAVNLIR